ncbi:M48 family metallopeptidase [Desulfonatronum lacustre]|uniref:M48 family metallopeptidase n=1 Tax=Desulfonatronum lacustre TaxID=66849 RepID=UPI00048DFAB3|nr:M48 family metallopeptidase [Desulfonatronum lacustre]
MDFFESQERARRKSAVLVVLFILATIGIVFTVYALIYLLLLTDAPNATQAWREFKSMADLLAMLGAIILAIIGFGTIFKMVQLRRGGAAVAELLGGRLVMPDSANPDERKVLNVVEEMAIASGLPVPPVYMLDQESGINAFAAGQNPGDAVVGLTSGAARLLTRSELQAVIGHEFSHILNGDMRMNIKLMSVIHGLIILGLAGRVILRMTVYGGRSRDRRGAALPLVLGVGFILVGSLGMFFGSMIKAAVSRQREYLADASAVQFTRDSRAMAEVLKKIGAISQGSRLEHANAAQASHMFFAQGVNVLMTSLFATHPPLEERIRRVEPGWDGTYPVISDFPRPHVRTAKDAAANEFGFSGLTPKQYQEQHQERPGPSSRPAVQSGTPKAIDLTASVGRLDDAHVAHARGLRERIPPVLLDAAHDTGQAQWVVFAMLLSREQSVARAQFALLDKIFGPSLAREVANLARLELPRELRLPLMDICFPALRRMPFDRYPAFRSALHGMIQADGRVGLFEWAVHRAVLRHLEPSFEPGRPSAFGHVALHQAVDQTSLILSALAHVGARAEDTAMAFEAGAKELRLPGLGLRTREQCGIQALDTALTKLVRLRESSKRDLITACAAVIVADGQVSIAQAEILRAVSDALECPMPPLLPGQVAGA